MEQGKIQWTGGSAFRATSGNLAVVGTGAGSTALVVRQGNELQVAALAGTVNVLLPGGQLIKSVATGTAFSFSDPQGATAAGQAVEQTGTTATTTAGTTATTAAGTAAAGTAAATGAAAAGAAATTTIAGLSVGTFAAVSVGVAAAIAIPAAVVATRDNGSVSK